MASVKHKLIKNFFSKNELSIIQKYCYNKLDQSKDYYIDEQSFSPAWYNDSLMNVFLDKKLDLIEHESNLKIFPTYAYWRYYVFGATLKKHTDRPACEISVTACIKKYDDWSIFIKDEEFHIEEGDAVLYAGHEVEHWRSGVYKGEGLAQVFLHYVNQDGDYTEHAYDNFLKTTGRKE